MSAVLVDYILLGIMILLGIWDIFLVTDKVKSNTISWRTRKNGKRTLLIPFYFGVLGGHFFHPFSDAYVNSLSWISTVVGLGVGTAISLLVSFLASRKPSLRNKLVFGFFLGGIVMGLIVWPV